MNMDMDMNTNTSLSELSNDTAEIFEVIQPYSVFHNQKFDS